MHPPSGGPKKLLPLGRLHTGVVFLSGDVHTGMSDGVAESVVAIEGEGSGEGEEGGEAVCARAASQRSAAAIARQCARIAPRVRRGGLRASRELCIHSAEVRIARCASAYRVRLDNFFTPTCFGKW